MLAASDLGTLEQEERIQLALAAVDDQKISLRRAAIDFQVPRSTLTSRHNGVSTRPIAHQHELKLTPAHEDVLVEWIKAMGHRGLPLTPQTLRDYASDICGKDIGASWSRRFMKRHPDIALRYTQSLEECRARALNRTVVQEFFTMLEDLISQYNIVPENIYNMDEKGIQLGIGKRIAALVDHNQKVAQHIEAGDRELVTIIETVCADGSSLVPSVIFQGKRRNLEWGRNNPCNASISVSEKGWTDQELGCLWLEKDFHPASSARNKTNGYRLLILDGHNSHCTYRFCKFAMQHQIVAVCLPAHTTHALQPCDVSVFGPLASSWKAEVLQAARDNIVITKSNLLYFYANARSRAFKETTIQASFKKTGIWPLDPSAISEKAFAPSLNTTTEAAQPLPAVLPSLLVPVNPVESAESGDTQDQSRTDRLAVSTEMPTEYLLVGLPPCLPHTASRLALQKENDELRALLQATTTQIQRDYAQKKLMDTENERLRKRLYAKDRKPKRIEGSGHPRHLTADESLDALAYAEWLQNIKAVHREASGVFKECRKKIDDERRRMEIAERLEEKQQKQLERARVQQLREEERAGIRQQKKEERLRKAGEKAALRKEAEERKAAEKARKMRTQGQKRKRSQQSDTETDTNMTHMEVTQPKPRPIPKRRCQIEPALQDPPPNTPFEREPSENPVLSNTANNPQQVANAIRRNPLRGNRK